VTHKYSFVGRKNQGSSGGSVTHGAKVKQCIGCINHAKREEFALHMVGKVKWQLKRVMRQHLSLRDCLGSAKVGVRYGPNEWTSILLDWSLGTTSHLQFLIMIS
jgi:hypothetical protein